MRSFRSLLKWEFYSLICFAGLWWHDFSYGQARVSPTPGVSSPSNPRQEKQFAGLKEEISNLQKRINTIEGSLKFDEFLLSEKQDRQDSIGLNLTDHTFQRLDADSGSFLVIVGDVTPYLNGYKVQLKIGNTSAANYSGVKIKMSWNQSFDYKKDSYDEWKRKLQEKEFPITDTLSGGAWTKVDLVVAPATTEQLGYVRMSMTAETVALNTK